MLKTCPICKHLSVEYDPSHRIEQCLNIECSWVNRGEESLQETESFEFPRMKLSEVLEKRNRITTQKA